MLRNRGRNVKIGGRAGIIKSLFFISLKIGGLVIVRRQYRQIKVSKFMEEVINTN